MIKLKGRKPARDWSLIDWLKSTSVLAEELNMRASSISRLRAQHAPKTKDRSNKTKIKYFIDWKSVDWSKRNLDISIELNIPTNVIAQKRNLFAPETIKRRNFLNL